MNTRELNTSKLRPSIPFHETRNTPKPIAGSPRSPASYSDGDEATIDVQVALPKHHMLIQ